MPGLLREKSVLENCGLSWEGFELENVDGRVGKCRQPSWKMETVELENVDDRVGKDCVPCVKSGCSSWQRGLQLDCADMALVLC